ncbi:MAG: hypothetical protein HC873_09550 [Leptolyngbyaceae cyanobacterium SL_1_1]|nr:hypothetical protein [Leptolyngbyaceae cyanobacterium SL_1_1]
MSLITPNQAAASRQRSPYLLSDRLINLLPAGLLNDYHHLLQQLQMMMVLIENCL